ncbi:MAG TPA: ATP-binding cassette domain-containing protein [Bryobacteraceae bacterium]|nr:ATP-binding cassette domain-containing protein [Bryobacteraceae bacterium]
MDVLLRFDNVSVAFDEVKALDRVSFEMHPGQTRIVFGAAGSGKTTLLKVAIGLIRPDAGRVFLFGQDITQMDERHLFDLRSKVGVLFQEGGLFDSLTVADNVAYPLVNQRAIRAKPEEVLSKVENALRFVELEHTLEKFPSELSGGMRRRVGIARAVVTEPPLVLFDSPTAGLDPITANTIMALIAKERDTSNSANLVVTHRYQDGQLMANFRYNRESGQLDPVSHNGARRDTGTLFMVLNEGRLVFEGSQSELESSTDKYVSKFVLRR